MLKLREPELKTCRTKSNLVGSFSIKIKDEKDYQQLRQHLYYTQTSIGEYLVECYRELDKLSYSN
tara:strand:+ start:241 stop:435 length:195 start_codon:yes stop_codon:yes gene_type:complete